MQNQNGISTLVGIAIIVSAIIVLFGGVFMYQYLTTKPQQNSEFFASRQKTNQTQNSNTETASWKTYKNDIVEYEISYPNIYEVKTSDCFAYKKDDQKLNDSKSINIGDDNLLSIHICHFNGVASDFFQESGFTPLTIANSESYKKEFEIKGGGRGWYYIQKDALNIIFIDAFWAYSGKFPNTVADQSFYKRKQTIDRILSTFKFTK